MLLDQHDSILTVSFQLYTAVSLAIFQDYRGELVVKCIQGNLQRLQKLYFYRLSAF